MGICILRGIVLLVYFFKGIVMGNAFRIKYSVGNSQPSYYQVEGFKEGIRMIKVFSNRDCISLENASKFLELQVFVDGNWEIWKDNEGNKATGLIKNI